VVKWLIIGLGASLLPIWKDVSTNRGQNLWEYLNSTAFTQRKHIRWEDAVHNYKRNKGIEV